MKWLGRDEWHDAFEDALDRHLQPACETTGIEVEEVISILDRNQYMMTVGVAHSRIF
jgi:allophanate hydrolase subunit 1